MCLRSVERVKCVDTVRRRVRGADGGWLRSVERVRRMVSGAEGRVKGVRTLRGMEAT